MTPRTDARPGARHHLGRGGRRQLREGGRLARGDGGHPPRRSTVERTTEDAGRRLEEVVGAGARRARRRIGPGTRTTTVGGAPTSRSTPPASGGRAKGRPGRGPDGRRGHDLQPLPRMAGGRREAGADAGALPLGVVPLEDFGPPLRTPAGHVGMDRARGQSRVRPWCTRSPVSPRLRRSSSISARSNARYYERHPDPGVAEAEGRVRHVGTSRFGRCAAASTRTTSSRSPSAICDYRAAQDITGPLFVGIDTHALSAPAQRTALEVLAANGVGTVMARRRRATRRRR